MIFGGRVHDAPPVLDSIRFRSSWHGATETLRYKYWIQKLEDTRGALDAWGKLEYLIYIGDLTGAVRTFEGYGIAGEAAEMMAVRLCRELAKAARFEEALSVLETVKDARSPEYLYFLAEMFSETGRTNEARTIAQKILKDHPADIFAQKARVLLLKI
jgi:tetratricopeptide (TPR) repeat protein